MTVNKPVPIHFTAKMCYNMYSVTARKGNGMNTKRILGGAVALSLTFAVGSASADDVQCYGATFESAASATPGEMNDWAYALDAGVTTYANATGEPYGWFGGADDASTIIAANGGQALQVDTGSSVLTNIDALGDGDPTFKTEASGLVTQTVTATFDTSSVTEKFFKAAIEFQHHEDLEDPGDTSDEEQELEE